MATYIFNGPTTDFGKIAPGAKVTLKLPLSNGSFQILTNVEPGVTELTITDAKAMAHVEALKDMSGVALYEKL